MDAHAKLVQTFAEHDPDMFARRVENMEPREAAKVIDGLPHEAASRVVAKLAPDYAARVSERLSHEQARHFLKRLDEPTASAILLAMPAERREAVLTGLPEGEARRLREHMAYAPDTAGGMMTPRVMSLSVDLTVQEAITVIRKTPRERIFYLYVTDRENQLSGVLSMRELLLAGAREKIESILHRDVAAVPPYLDREEVARIMHQRGLQALPVVDAENRLLGAVSGERAIAAVQAEAFEDLQLMSGAGGDERALSPLRTLMRKRLPWLSLNLGTAFLAALMVGVFEDVIGKLTALAVLMPIVSAVSGNTGIQALSVVMRGLALREIGPGNRWRVVLKEGSGAFLNGVVIAALCGGAAWLWFGRPELAGVIALTMVINMLTAGCFGAAIPLILRAMGRDPAQSSSIFLTTVTDVVGFGSFLGLAAWLLKLY
jgi:magnesium transporter